MSKFNDITKSGLLNRPVVYIVGSGHNGVEAYGKLPEGGCVIACNRAVLAPIPATIWICEDAGIPSQEWFPEALSKKVVRIFSDSIAKRYPSDYQFRHHGIWKGKPAPVNGSTFGGGTVACRAVQLSVMSGAKTIILCGVDMSGNLYFDGQENKCQVELRSKGAWKESKNFDEIIRWLRKSFDFEIFTLSVTSLKEPVIM